MRINKFIALNSPISRRKADELIKKGEVYLNGEKVIKLGIQIIPEKDKIQIIGNTNLTIQQNIIQQKENKTYLALNKPTNYITTRNDEFNRKTVMELVPKDQNLKPIGRLDMDTEGLLLFSNDGDFINRCTHPRFECEKEYFAVITGKLDIKEKKQLESGIEIENRLTAKAKIKILKNSKKETFLTMTIHEGRNRQIRKMFDHINHPVKYLQRIRIGKIKLGTLELGKYRLLTKKEISC